MSDEPFLLVSLEEEKAKALAQVLSNDTSRKILDMLSKTDKATESDIAKELKIPLSTVHYNVSMLVKADLVSDNYFNYSEKGKKVVHYALSNKYVIIAPKKTEILKEKLKQFLPVVLITTAISVGIKYLWPTTNQLAYGVMADSAIAESQDVAAKMLTRAGEPVYNSFASNQDFAVWFLLGSVSAILIYFVWAEIILKNKKK